jgi:hypothetical protein
MGPKGAVSCRSTSCPSLFYCCVRNVSLPYNDKGNSRRLTDVNRLRVSKWSYWGLMLKIALWILSCFGGGDFKLDWWTNSVCFRSHRMRYFGTRESLCQKALLPGRVVLAVPRFLIVTTETKYWSLSDYPERARHNSCCGFGSLIAGNLECLVDYQSLSAKDSDECCLSLVAIM